jgi:uncharacterized YigZ family protein
MNNYKTVTETCEWGFTEKKSEFIATLAHVGTQEEALEIISAIRATHRKARHVCYAYIVRENSGENDGNDGVFSTIERYCDDGEPSGTAGMPILEVLRKNELFDVVCTVRRFFGGILLGAGGLTRAYSKAASLAVANNHDNIAEFKAAHLLCIKAAYSYYGNIVSAIADFDGIRENEAFSDDVQVAAALPVHKVEDFVNKLTDLCNGNVFIEYSQKCFREFG